MFLKSFVIKGLRKKKTFATITSSCIKGNMLLYAVTPHDATPQDLSFSFTGFNTTSSWGSAGGMHVVSGYD